jgi:hypothetical protein
MPREHERIPFFIEAQLECSSGRREARISDLSYGGCYIDSIAGVRPGENISFEIVSPSGATISFSGNVAYVLEGSGFGVKFVGLTSDQTDFIKASMSSYES